MDKKRDLHSVQKSTPYLSITLPFVKIYSNSCITFGIVLSYKPDLHAATHDEHSYICMREHQQQTAQFSLTYTGIKITLYCTPTVSTISERLPYNAFCSPIERGSTSPRQTMGKQFIALSFINCL